MASTVKADLVVKKGFINDELTTAFLVTFVKAVGQSITLPPAWDTLAIATHEDSRDVAVRGEVIPWKQLALC